MASRRTFVRRAHARTTFGPVDSDFSSGAADQSSNLNMTDLIKISKKIFTVGVVTTTIMWSLGVAALVPGVVNAAADCPTLVSGQMIKVSGKPAIYVLDSNLKYRYFSDGDVFKSWNADDAYGKYYTTVSQACFDSLSQPTTAPYHVFYRPGSTVVKYLSSDTLYVVKPNNTLQPITDAAAKVLYGTTYKVKTIGLSEWPYYTKETTTITEAKAHAGMVVANGGKNWYVNSDNKLQEVSASGLTANRLRTPRAVADSVIAGLATDSTKVEAAVTTLTERVSGAGSGEVTGGVVTVSLAANTPAAGYIAKGAYNAEFSNLTFKNTSSASVRVDKIVIKRDGLGTDTDITAIRLYDGATQIGSDQALNTNTHLATFGNLNWDIAAGATKTLSVKADTYASASGTNDYLALYSLELEGEGSISASLPIAGNAMQYHSVTVGVVDVDALSTPGGTTLISGATDQQVACFNIDTDSSEGVYLKSMTLTNAGTAANDDLTKFVLKQGATVLSTYDGAFNSSGKMTFDLTASPYFIDKSKSKDVCVYVDIKSGIKASLSKTIILQIEQSKDVVISGDSSKAQIVVTKDNATAFTAQSSQSMTIGQGTLTVTRNTATLPVSTALINGVNHNKLAAYKFTAGSTEGVKVTRLRLTVSGSGVSSTDLSNFELYTYDEATAKETQVGTSQSISGSYVTFEDTSDGLFTIEKSKNVILHVYADVNTAASWSGTVANVYIGTTNSDLIVKGVGLESGEYIKATDVTLSSVDGEHTNVTLFSLSSYGTLTVSLDNSSPAATSLAKGVYDYDFAHIKLYAASENMSVTGITLRSYEDSDTGVTDVIDTADNAISNVRLYDMTDPVHPVQLGSAVSSPAAGVATFSFTLTVPKDNYKVLKVVADVPSNCGASYIKFALPGAGTIADDITTTGVSSGSDIGETGSATGKTMTVAAPTVTTNWASGVTNNMVANATEQTLGTLQLTAGAYEDVRVTTIKVSVSSNTVSGLPSASGASSADTDLTNFKLVGTDGTQYGITKSLTDGTPDYVQFEGITNLTVTKGNTKIIYVKANVAGTSGTYYVGNRSNSDIVGSGAVSGGSATITGTGAGPANTIQSVATLTFALDASNPLTKLVAVGANGTGTEETLMALSADSLYEDVDITKLVFHVIGATGDSVQNDFADNGIKLYHKVGTGSEVLVGSATIVSSTAAYLGTYYTATFNITQGDLRIGKSTDDVLILKTIFKGTDSGLTAATSPYFQLGDNSNTNDSLFVEAKGASSGTSLDDNQFNTTSALNVTGNQVVAYKAYPTFSYVNPGSVLVNGAENDLFSFKVRANGGSVALKQLRFGLLVTDNVGTANNSYDLESFKFYRGTTNLTDTVLILDYNGDSLEGSVSSPTVFPSGTTKYIYVVWPTTNEEVIAQGTEYTYTIKATLSGFTTPADDDNVRVRLENADSTELSQSNDTYYLMPFDAGGQINLLGLADSASTNGVTSTASLLWSDKSASSHSAATGSYAGGTASSSGDWFNGYQVGDTPTSWATLTN